MSISVTVGSTGFLLVGYSAQMSNNTTVAICFMVPVLSGANTFAASDTVAALHQDASANVARSQSKTKLFTGLNTGSTTIVANFKVASGGSGAGTGTFSNRELWAIPL